jgi:hypothetical protein
MSKHHVETDPVYQNSKRETFWILLIWAAFALWVVGVAGWLGFDSDPNAPVKTVWGFPDWVFWGIAIPWLGANIVIIYFANKVMKDDPLSDGENTIPPNQHD